VTWWRRWREGGRQAASGASPGKGSRVDRVLQAAAIAEADGDAGAMHKASNSLIRLELYERAWQLRINAARLTEQSPLPEWDGDDLTGRTILVRAYTPRDRIGEELRLARFIAPVARQARRAIVLAEHRLVPLLRRSFAGADVRPRGVDNAAAFAEADVAAYYETIALRYAKTAEAMRGAFVPLQADPARSRSLRQRYAQGSGGPLIGISWGSSNEHKVLPPLTSWAPLLGWPSATFVALQYGDIDRDLEVLREFGGRVINDTEIDQRVDLDGFAAQIAALDAVVSISNTTIDMAGMLGVPTVHVRDDKPSAIWPRSGPSPWYPDMTFLYRGERPWPELFADAKARLERLTASSAST